ncbi:Catsper1, partial [Symbiodinium microadriaticum]
MAIVPPSSTCDNEDSWLAWTSSEGSSVDMSDSDAEPGVIQRFGKWRVGRDRWHNPDGSLINRGRHNLATTEGEELPSIAEEDSGFSVSGVNCSSGEPVVTVHTASGETFKVRASLPSENLSSDQNSTSASSHGGVTSSPTTNAIGFWQHGRWVPRARTPKSCVRTLAVAGNNGCRGRCRESRTGRMASGNQPGFFNTLVIASNAFWHKVKPTHKWIQHRAHHDKHDLDVDDLDTVLSLFGYQYQLDLFVDKLELYMDKLDPNLALLEFDNAFNMGVFLNVLLYLHWILLVYVAHDIVDYSVSCRRDEVFFMQLTPAERTRLAEDGVPTSIIDRLEAYFESLQRQQDMERGPEGRWALGRVHQRLQDGMEAMDTLFEIVGRRLVPRGFWPIQRLPSSTAVRTSMYQWAGHLRSMVVDLMEAHFQVPLQESELNSINQFLREPVPTGTSDGEPDAASGSRLETSIRTSETEGDFVAATSSSSSSGATGMSRDRSHSPTVRVTRESTCPSPDRGGGIGTPVLDGGQVGVEHNLSSTALSDEALQFWLSSDMRPVLDGELRGVWAEYCPDSTAASSSGDPGPSSSTTSTTTTPDETEDHQPLVLVQKQLDLVYWDDCSTMASPCPSTTTSTPMQPVDLTCWEHGWLNPSSSTSTTTSTRSQSDVIRDAVNQALVHGSQVDVVDFVRRVLDRQRKLRHEDRLLGEALEEAIAWLPHTQQALPLNAAEFDRSVYAHVARLVASGSATGSADPPAPDTSLAVLLQPNFPEDTDAVSTALPGFSPAVGTNTQADRLLTLVLFFVTIVLYLNKLSDLVLHVAVGDALAVAEQLVVDVFFPVVTCAATPTTVTEAAVVMVAHLWNALTGTLVTVAAGGRCAGLGKTHHGDGSAAEVEGSHELKCSTRLDYLEDGEAAPNSDPKGESHSMDEW